MFDQLFASDVMPIIEAVRSLNGGSGEKGLHVIPDLK